MGVTPQKCNSGNREVLGRVAENGAAQIIHPAVLVIVASSIKCYMYVMLSRDAAQH